MKQLSLVLPGGAITPPPNIPSGINAPANIFQTGISLFILVVFIAALLFTIYGGILWAMSGGDKQKLDRARSTITFSIVGMVVTVLAFVIVQTIGLLLGFSYLQNFGK